MAFIFEWDPAKATENAHKHGGSFEECTTVFDDPLSATIHDPDHSLDEVRLVIFGVSMRGRILAVMHTDRGPHIRILSAREATRVERGAYEEGIL